MTTMGDPLLGSVLQQRRQELALTLRDVAERTGWKAGLKEVSEIERGIRNPQWSSVQKLLTALEWTWLEIGVALVQEQEKARARSEGAQ